MSIFKKISNRLKRIVAQNSTPVMILQKKNFQGEKTNNTRISTSTLIDHAETLYLEDNIFIGHFNFIESSNNIYIDEGVQITNFCSITSHSSHNSIRLYGKHYSDFSEHIGYVKGEIRIGKYTFVGPHSLIMPNTNIGKGCIVSAYSNVRGNFPDFSIIAGNPAKVIGSVSQIDKKYIQDNLDLNNFYKEWSVE